MPAMTPGERSQALREQGHSDRTVAEEVSRRLGHTVHRPLVASIRLGRYPWQGRTARMVREVMAELAEVPYDEMWGEEG